LVNAIANCKSSEEETRSSNSDEIDFNNNEAMSEQSDSQEILNAEQPEAVPPVKYKYCSIQKREHYKKQLLKLGQKHLPYGIKLIPSKRKTRYVGSKYCRRP